MKILHIIDSGGLYGAEVMLLGLMVEQQALGHQPVLASIGHRASGEKPVEERARSLGLMVVPFRFADGPNFVGAMNLIGYARKLGADIIHSHGYKGNILLGLLPSFLRHGLPLMATVHGYTSGGRVCKMALYEWLDRVALRRMNRVVVVNPQMLELPQLQSMPNLCAIGNGLSVIPSEEPLPPTLSEFIARRPTLVAVGRLSFEKGFNFLVEALATLVKNGRDCQLLLLGEGAQRAELTRIITTHGLAERVLMPGYCNCVGACLRQAQVLVMPSLTEGLPMTLLEAMHARIPVVASAVGGIPEVLADGTCGTLVPPRKVADLSSAVEMVLNGGQTVSAMVERAAERVATVYSSRAMARRYLQVYQEINPAPGLEELT